MQTDSPCEGMAAPGGRSPPVVSREPVESSLGQQELLIFPSLEEQMRAGVNERGKNSVIASLPISKASIRVESNL